MAGTGSIFLLIFMRNTVLHTLGVKQKMTIVVLLDNYKKCGNK